MISLAQDIELVLDALQSLSASASSRERADQALALWYRIRDQYNQTRARPESAFTVFDQRRLAIAHLVDVILGDEEVEALRGNDPAGGCTTIVLRLSRGRGVLESGTPKHQRYEYAADLIMAASGQIEKGGKL